MANKGRLFVIEGPDGCGKSTLARQLTGHLVSQGVPCDYASYPGHIPGTLGNLVYELHHDLAKFGLKRIDPSSLQLLHIAAHIDAIEAVLRPAIEAGRSIVLDRFWWSTWVYGVFTGANRESIRKMVDIELEHWSGIRPECVFLALGVESGENKVSRETFEHLSVLYRRLAEEEAKNCRVHVLAGLPSLDQTFAQVVRFVDVAASEQIRVDKR